MMSLPELNGATEPTRGESSTPCFRRGVSLWNRVETIFLTMSWSTRSFEVADAYCRAVAEYADSTGACPAEKNEWIFPRCSFPSVSLNPSLEGCLQKRGSSIISSEPTRSIKASNDSFGLDFELIASESPIMVHTRKLSSQPCQLPTEKV
jgi:hypothetical protein